MTKEERIDSIALRITAEFAKHTELDWARIAAHKIYATHLESLQDTFTANDVERAYDNGYNTEGEVNFDIKNYLEQPTQ